jgi:cytoplasmic iron level regulating protein YaaA (DUF328/UPF0246 family)
MALDRRLLILSCSRRKRPDADLMPALERYDGGGFRVLRKLQRTNKLPTSLDVMILSAQYGLISAATSIAWYDQKMTPQRASELRQDVSQRLRDRLAETPYTEIFMLLGETYREALDIAIFTDVKSRIIFSQGGIGQQLRQLKNWLVSTKDE